MRINNESISFTKYSGTGNDFIIIDNRKLIFKNRADIIKFTKSACAGKTGIGADGILLLEKSSLADFKMRIINADGSEPEMCGNGARCIAHFAFSAGLVKKLMIFETIAGLISAEIKNNNIIKVKLPDPKNYKPDMSLKYNNSRLSVTLLNTSVPHAVIFVKNINKIDVFNTGRFIRNHSMFKPAGTNVNFVMLKNKNTIYVRTYERGVEDETLACGTGSTASAIIAALLYKIKMPVNVITRSGEQLKIYSRMDLNNITDVYLEGRVRPVFSGITKFNNNNLYID